MHSGKSILLALLVPAVVRPNRLESAVSDSARVCWTWWCTVLFLAVTYVFYWVFDAWWFLRFLLTAFPPLLVLTAVALDELARRAVPRYRSLIVAASVCLVASHGVHGGINGGVNGGVADRVGAAVGQGLGTAVGEAIGTGVGAGFGAGIGRSVAEGIAGGMAHGNLAEHDDQSKEKEKEKEKDKDSDSQKGRARDPPGGSVFPRSKN